MVGRVLAQYQISEKLGEGGMGIVWKARDTHLDRFVALKTLPQEKLADPERKRRSVQEAKAASALNHPNIVHIYDIAEADGIQYISMEYVPGKTLDRLIGRKGLRLNEALKYAVQIADALAQAHAAGIIHRDLKPSNIIVGESGNVKVLDFGLAKLTAASTSGFDETATMRAQDGPTTEEGVVLGTVAYMSPEQAEGKKIDARSDIFSFGSMLYEVVTGRQAFHGDSKMSTLSAILKEDPKPLSAVLPDAPRDLEKLITRCLRKDPDRRFQHMADIKVALEELKEESESGRLTSIVPQSGLPPKKLRSMWALIGAAILLIATTAVGLWFLRPRPHQSPTIVPLTSYAGSQITPAFSPDGKQVAFAWDGEHGGNFDIYVKLVDAGTPLRLTNNPANEYTPAWSPDSKLIAFDSPKAGNSDIYVISPDGGPVRRVTSGPSDNIRPSWSRGGRWIYFGSNRSGNWQIWKAPAQGGTALQVTHKGGREAFESFDGKFVYYAKASSAGIWQVPVEGGEETQLLKYGKQSLWALTQKGIYFGEMSSSAVPALKFYRFATHQVETFKEFSKETRFDSLSTAFSVSPDGQWIIYTQLDHAGSDLLLMENYR